MSAVLLCTLWLALLLATIGDAAKVMPDAEALPSTVAAACKGIPDSIIAHPFDCSR
jgi:hypothetical protein